MERSDSLGVAPGKANGAPRRSGWVRTVAADVPPRLLRMRFARSTDDAIIAGVAGGLGSRLGVDPVLVRIAFVLLSFAGAVGVVLYVGAWIVSVEPGDPRAPAPRERTLQQGIAFGFVVLGTLLLLRGARLWFGDQLGVPLVIAAVGAGVVYVGTGGGTRRRWTRFGLGGRSMSTTRPSIGRLVTGGVLVVAGVIWFLATNRSIEGVLGVLVAVAVTAAGIALVFGPWAFRLADQVGAERRERIRSEERSELAAHLHDSVLQTLALIQRSAGDPRRMASLARRQERELRAWLYGSAEAGADRLVPAMEAMAAEVEEAHEVPVEVVVVGDCPLDDRVRALVGACREAANNAAVHSGSHEVSVYVECQPGIVEAYVRDRGNGFDPHAPTDRRGITDSIKGRIERHGGSVSITSAAGEGCEVRITMPRPGAAT